MVSRSRKQFPEIRENPWKTSKIPFLGARIVTVPSVCVWRGTGETVGSTTETLKSIGKMKGSARVLASFLSHALPSAHSFPDPHTVSEIRENTLGKQAKTQAP